MLAVDRTVLPDNALRNYLRRVPNNSVLYYPGLDYDNWYTNQIRDYSGYANHGTIVGCTTARVHSKKVPYGFPVLGYDGNDYIDIDVAVNDLAATTIGSWVLWVNVANISPGSNPIILSVGDTDAGGRIILFYTAVTALLRAIATVGGVTQWDLDTDAAVFSNGTWVLVGLVHNGTAPVLMVNNAQPAQAFTTQTDNTVWFNSIAGLDNGRIGCGNYNNGGNTSFLAVNDKTTLPIMLNSVITLAQFTDIYNKERPIFGA